MPNFRATVGTAAGERIVVERESSSAQALTDEMAARGMYVIDVSPVASERRGFLRGLLEGFSQADLLELTRALRTLVKAGMPIYQAIELIAQGEDSRYRRRLLTSLLHDLSHGLSLSEAMAKRPDAFPVYYSKTVQASEATGTLDGTLADLAGVLQRSLRIRAKMVSTSIYPVILLCMVFGVILLMLGFVLPRMEAFFLGMGVELPWDTQMLLAMSRWLTGNVLKCLVFAVALVYFGWRVYTEPSLRRHFDAMRYRWPALGSLARLADLALVARTISALVGSGIPANDALRTAEETTPNSVLRAQIAATTARVERGEAMSSAAARSGLLDPRSCRVLRVGEESGSLSESFAELSDYCEERLEAATERFLALMEPAMVVCIGLLILVVLATVLRPMLESMSRL